MTYYGGAEMATSFQSVRTHTIRIAEDIPEEQYGFVAVEGTRSIARQLVHIAVAPRVWMQIHEVERRTAMAGFDFGAIAVQLRAEEAAPRSKAQIVDLLRTEGERAAVWLAGMSEAFLTERVTGENGQPPGRTRFDLLLGMKEHEMHHRGQLMVHERLLGIVPHLTRQMEELIARTARSKSAGG